MLDEFFVSDNSEDVKTKLPVGEKKLVMKDKV